MYREHHRWFSPNLQRDIDVLVYGSYGKPMLVFPTAAANCYEYEDFGMIAAIAHRIDAGQIKVFCIDSVNNESWMNQEAPLHWRSLRQAQYDGYVRNEIVPFIHDACKTPGIPVITTGSSFGAYHAANSLFKHPDAIKCCIAMSGLYDLRRCVKDPQGYDDNFYFNNPVDYLANMNDDYYLPLLRQTCDINIVCGTGPWENPDFSRQISTVLAAKEIPHNLDLWGSEVAHDWPWWMKEINQYLDRIV